MSKSFKDMDTDTKTNLEYEHQFFGFSSQLFLDCFKEYVLASSVTTRLESFIIEFRKKLENGAKDKIVFEERLKIFQNSLLSEYNEGISRSMLQLKTMIEKYLVIPENVLLPEDKAVCLYKNRSLTELEKDIEDCINKKKNLEFLKKTKKQELVKAKRILEHKDDIERRIKCIKHMDDGWSDLSTEPLTQILQLNIQLANDNSTSKCQA